MLSNNQVITQSQALFAHDARFNLPAAFANREQTRDQLRQYLEDRDNIVLISDLLGSGKTFFVDMVRGAMNLPEERMLICGRCSADDAQRRSHDDTYPVFIDEWDIKANPRRMLASLEQVNVFSAKQHQPLVLIGDFTLRSSGIQRQLRESGRQVQLLDLEPLLPDFFRLSLRYRVVHAFKSSIEPIGACQNHQTALEDQWIDFIEPALLRALVPHWPTSAATFREVFRLLTELSYYLPPDNQPCSLGGDQVRRWFADNPQQLKPEQKTFLRRWIAQLSAEEAVQPCTGEALREFADSDPERFYADVLQPLARMGLLAAMGNPELNETEYRRYPEPYLPGSKTRMAARYGIDL